VTAGSIASFSFGEDEDTISASFSFGEDEDTTSASFSFGEDEDVHGTLRWLHIYIGKETEFALAVDRALEKFVTTNFIRWILLLVLHLDQY
jgi:hypothetical protein